MQLYRADCLEILSKIESESIDLVVTDCPYHIVAGGCTNVEELGGLFKEFKGAYTREGKLFKHNEIGFDEWLPDVYRVLKKDTHCYVMINARNLKDLWISAEKAGFKFQNLLVWDKGNLTPNKWYMGGYELILMLRKGRARKINNKGTSNILRIPNIRLKKHPTEKPAALMQILIENSTNQGDIVLDPFMGVGGTGMACKQLKRDFIGIEIDQTYFDISKQRIEEEEELSLFDFGLKGG